MRTTLARVAGESKSAKSMLPSLTHLPVTTADRQNLAHHRAVRRTFDLATRLETRLAIRGMDRPISTLPDRRVKRFMLATTAESSPVL